MALDEGQENERSKLELTSWITGFFLLTIVLPLLIIYLLLPADQRADGLAILAAVPLIEYLAISVGIGLGVDPVLSFVLTVLPSIGICMLVFGLLSYFGEKSQRMTRFQGKVHKRMDKYPKLKRYGVVSNAIFVIIAGIYIGSGIAWLLGWSRFQSILMMALGIVSITLLIGLGTVGIIELFFV